MIKLLTILLLTTVSYTKTLVQVPVAHGDTVTGYLLVPDAAAELGRPNGYEGAGCPAIVAMHDHGAWFTIGKEKLTPPVLPLRGGEKMEEAWRWVDKFYEGQFVADTLASRGYVVLVIDALYWGERGPGQSLPEGMELDSLKRLNKRLKNEQEVFYRAYLEQYGVPWFEKILADDKACVDYLRSLPYVDAERIGVWGFSMGAYRAWQLAAEDKRVAFCAAANWLTTLEKVEHGVSSWSMLRPKMVGIEYSEIVCRIAPRPMLLQYGLRDKLFPEPVLKEGQWEALTIQAIDSEHRFTKEHMRLLLEWLDPRFP